MNDKQASKGPYRADPPPPCAECAKRASKPTTKRVLTGFGWGAVRLASGLLTAIGSATALELGCRPWVPFLSLIVIGGGMVLSGFFGLDVYDKEPLMRTEKVER